MNWWDLSEVSSPLAEEISTKMASLCARGSTDAQYRPINHFYTP